MTLIKLLEYVVPIVLIVGLITGLYLMSEHRSPTKLQKSHDAVEQSLGNYASKMHCSINGHSCFGQYCSAYVCGQIVSLFCFADGIGCIHSMLTSEVSE